METFPSLTLKPLRTKPDKINVQDFPQGPDIAVDGAPRPVVHGIGRDRRNGSEFEASSYQPDKLIHAQARLSNDGA